MAASQRCFHMLGSSSTLAWAMMYCCLLNITAKKLKRPKVGYELAYLEVLDVDNDASEEFRKIILSAENCINLTPSPLLITPDSSCRASLASLQSTPCVLTPATSCQASPELTSQQSPIQYQFTSPQSSPQVQAQQELHVESLDGFNLDAPVPAPQTLGGSVPLEEDSAPVTQLRQILLDKAAELGVATPQLAPVLQSFDALELRMAVLDKAKELGVAQAQLAPVLRSINDLPKKAGATPKSSKTAKKSVPTTTRRWHARRSATMAAQAA